MTIDRLWDYVDAQRVDQPAGFAWNVRRNGVDGVRFTRPAGEVRVALIDGEGVYDVPEADFEAGRVARP